jgi:hypothetical protein
MGSHTRIMPHIHRMLSDAEVHVTVTYLKGLSALATPGGNP